MSAIVIVDYGMANLRSVQKAFERLGHPAVITSDHDHVGSADKLVVPGVGAFRDAIAKLHEARLVEPILNHLRASRPFLGICLGLQLLFSRSFEAGEHRGLDWFAGDVVRFPDVPGLKVPHMGWNQLRHSRPDCPLLRDVPAGSNVYFVHSYYVRPAHADIVASTTDYGEQIAAVVWRDRAFATQFHPEKSQGIGLTMLKNFAGI
jgi:glutamine amidotransferase